MMVVPLLDNTIQSQIIKAAHSWIDTPYLHQASIKGLGCDCLGLVRGIWREVLGNEPQKTPPYTPDWAESGGREQLVEAASQHMKRIESNAFLPGDMLVFRWRKHLPSKHLAIVATPTTMIHAQEGAKVCEVVISPWWQRHISHVFRFPEIPNNALKNFNQKGHNI